jgi:group I intron endonuclease
MNNEAITNDNAGIYALICTETGQRYVGCSADIRQRINVHFSDMKRSKHHSRLVQELYDTHGRSAFTWEVLEVIEDDEQRHAIEKEYIRSGMFDLNLLSSPIHERPRCLHRRKPMRDYSGEKSTRFLGFYHVPWGRYATSRQAAHESKGLISHLTVQKNCRNPDKIISKQAFGASAYLQSFGPSVIGKSWRELGFWFEPKKP